MKPRKLSKRDKKVLAALPPEAVKLFRVLERLADKNGRLPQDICEEIDFLEALEDEE